MVRGAAFRLAAVLALGSVLVVAVQAAADMRLVAPTPTRYVTDRNGLYLTQAGHEAIRPDGGRQVEYGYWPVTPPPNVVAATIALEDRRFWTHPGVDPAAVLRAVWQHLRGGHGSGASTLAMQVVRMQHPRPRTLWSKAIEAGAALGITLRYGRAAVLAQYLRLAPYGEGSHGIAHAARWYFDRPAADLSPAQAALLCAIPQAPGLMSLRPNHIARTRARATRALMAMPLSPHARAAALAELSGVTPRPAPRRPAELLAVLHLQALARALPPSRGAILHAMLGLSVQDWVRRRAVAHLAGWRAEGAQQVAVMVVRRRDRAVLADIASGGIATRPGGAIDFTRTLRSPGSTLKPFLYAIGLERGLIAPNRVVADLATTVSGIRNADRADLGPLLPRQALANSRNVPAAELLRRIGLRRAFDALRDLGLHRLDGPAARYGLAMAIGALPTTLQRLTRAYATLADDGVDRGLAWFADSAEAPRRLLTIDAARLVARFLSDPMARLPSFPRYGSSEFPFAAAIKTGTSQGYRDAWAMTWSSEYVVGVWVGRADAGPMRRLGGARAAAGLAQDVLLRLHGSARTDLVAGAFAAPPGRTQAELCTATGRPATQGCDERLTEWVKPGPAPAPRLAPQLAPEPRLEIVRPDNNTHFWRNPDLPGSLDRLVLRAKTDPAVPQIVWLVNGKPVSVGPPDTPLVWTMVPGRFRFQVRLPLRDTVSSPVTVVIE